MTSAPYAQQYALAQDPLFLNRLQAAVVSGAAQITASTLASGDGNLAVYQLRMTLAAAVLADGADAWLPRFAAAVACHPVIAADLASAVPVLIASSTAAMPSVITTVAEHGLTSGDIAEIAGHDVNTAVNGTWAVTVLTSTTFSVPVPGSGAGDNTGTVTLQPPDADLDTAIAAVWSGVAGATAAT